MTTTKVKLPLQIDKRPLLGSDPEFFFRVKNKVVGAEHFLPKDGLIVSPKGPGNNYENKFIIDGVQAELNPIPATCRQGGQGQIMQAFRTLKKHLASLGDAAKDVKVCIDNTIEIEAEELDKLSEANKQLGCMPSFNAYRDTTGVLAGIDATIMRIRSGGGHIHIGIPKTLDHYDMHANKTVTGPVNPLAKRLKEDNVKEFLHMLDIIAGNTCVLVDRDPGNKIRRKLYGQAGEYRLPEHGLEYRTLSNFWLKSYPLMSLAYGLVRLAYCLMADDKNWQANYKAFTEAVDIAEVERAINTNNYRLAMKNFKAIKPLLEQVAMADGQTPISSRVMKEFMYFVEVSKEKGLEHWFPQDPFEHWSADGSTNNRMEPSVSGFHDFLYNIVRADMKKHEAEKAKETKAE